MIRRFSVNFAILSMALDAGLTLLALSLAVAIRPQLRTLPFLRPVEPPVSLHPLIYLIVPLLWVTIFLIGSVYDPKRIYKLVDELQLLTLSTGFASLCFAGLLFLSFSFRGISRWLFLIFVALDLAFLVGWRLLSRLVFRWGNFPRVHRRVLIIGAGEEGRQVAQMVDQYDWARLHLVGYLDDKRVTRPGDHPVVGRLREVRRVVEQYQVNDIVMALPGKDYERINELVVTLHDLPVNVRVVPDYFSLAVYRAQAEVFGGLPMISLRDPALNDVQRLIKRLLDLSLGTALSLLALPLGVLIALAIKLDSKGAVLFQQQRVGENGSLFTMYKFRSMVDGAEEMQNMVNETNANGELIHKHLDDPRITRVGRFLRRTSLDELPQLLNVLKGDMSLVGPRPELPWIAAQYEPWQRKRLVVPQGMTGWWQVNGRSDKPMHLHTEDDIYYVQNYSLSMDFLILFKTLWVVLRGKGAY